MNQVQLYSAPWVLTMAPDATLLEDGALVVDGDQLIAVGPRTELMQQHPQATETCLPDRLLMPGLVNAHMHSGLLRGTAEGRKLWDWLRLYIDPMHRVLTPADAEAASWLCYAEALLSGTTTVVDMWRYLDGSAQAARQLGNRAVLVPYVGEHPDYDYFDTLDDNEALIERWAGKANGRIMPWVGMEHLFYFTEDAWGRAVAMADRHQVGLHTHVGESQAEVRELQQRYGLRPVHAMERFGFLDLPQALFAHCVWLDDSEIALMARKGVGVAHNPTSNMKLVSGMAPVSSMIAAGVAVGLGSDGEKENNNLDLFEEMKFASLLGKLREDDATAADAWQVLRMATIEGARALGLADQIGSLEPGKKADFIAVRTDTPRMTPLLTGESLNVHHNLVYAVQGGDVSMVVCDGQLCVQDGTLRTADLGDIRRTAQASVPDLFQRRAAWLADHDQGAVSPVDGD
jgi:5-methylthioadenosine/S-adenosylhomocysteine deaminase